MLKKRTITISSSLINENKKAFLKKAQEKLRFW